jgi:putative lipase involved disintegration of autophagic bodies
MPTDLEYALFAANSYAASPLDVDPVNAMPVASGWNLIADVDQLNTGFSARVYRNDLTSEIVIAYAGTSVAGNFGQQARDWLQGNITAGSGLRIGNSFAPVPRNARGLRRVSGR